MILQQNFKDKALSEFYNLKSGLARLVKSKGDELIMLKGLEVIEQFLIQKCQEAQEAKLEEIKRFVNGNARSAIHCEDWDNVILKEDLLKFIN